MTVDDARPTAEALAVTDGRIAAVGDHSDIENWIGADTQIMIVLALVLLRPKSDTVAEPR